MDQYFYMTPLMTLRRYSATHWIVQQIRQNNNAKGKYITLGEE